MRIGLIVGILLVLVGGAAAWLMDRGGIFPTKEIRYRFEVAVETPDGPMTGYSVHRIVIQDTTMSPSRNYQVKVYGEAVPFELADGRLLLATLSTVSGAGLQQVFGSTVGLSTSGQWIDAPGEFDADVSSKFFPKLAIIADLNDPDTLKPADTGGEFSVSRVRLISTTEPVTNDLSNLLPWLVEAIRTLPTFSADITPHHVLISGLKLGVRS